MRQSHNPYPKVRDWTGPLGTELKQPDYFLVFSSLHFKSLKVKFHFFTEGACLW